MIDALIIFAILIVLLFARLPVGFAMAGVGIIGFAYYVGWPGTFAMIGRIAFDTPQRAEFAVVPLFVLMGNFITRAGLADELYSAAYAWIGHRRGGLAMATIISCGGFSAVCGSSVATAATMAKVAMPPMRHPVRHRNRGWLRIERPGNGWWPALRRRRTIPVRHSPQRPAH